MTRPILPEPKRFVAKPAVIDQGYGGGSISGLDAGAMARGILGPIDWNAATTYMMRRFGPPNKPCDAEHEITGWLIQTPMRDVHLSFRSAPGEVDTLFSWVGMGNMGDEIRRCAASREERRRADFGRWCREVLDVDWPSQETFDTAMERFRSENAAPDPDDLLRHAREALSRTIHDLRRTVSIRDTCIDVRGETERRFGHVARAPTCGAYIPPVAYDKAMWGVYGAIHRLGGGRKGIDALLAALQDRT